MPRPEVSLVIPIYNEEAVLPRLDERVLALLEKLGEVACEVVFVDDGSKDRSLEILRTMVEREPRYRAVSFSRNFGHQRAITAGMDAARGKAVVVMDADLQDPPEVIQDMIAKWREGYDVVYGRRRSRAGETKFKLFTAKIFYRLFAAMIPIEVPLDTGDFRLMSRRVIIAMRELRETHLFVRGLVAWLGFKQTAVEYDRQARAAGETKYPLRKMLAFAFDGIMSFSILPLRLSTYLGAFVGIASVIYGFIAVLTYVIGFTQPGWTTTVVLVSFLFSVQLLMTGLLGEYIGRIYEQVKLRPLYVVGERIRHRSMRKRITTGDFASVGEIVRATDRPPAGAAPPQAAGAAPTDAAAPKPSNAPPPLPVRASTKMPAASPATVPAFPPPPVVASSSSPPSKPPPPLPSAAKNRDKT
jgi:polyisoprenyl-phosphate glycosyltransferase